MSKRNMGCRELILVTMKNGKHWSKVKVYHECGMPKGFDEDFRFLLGLGCIAPSKSEEEYHITGVGQFRVSKM